MHEHTTAELLQLQSQGHASAEEITAAYLQRIRERDPQILAFLAVDEAGALDQARAVDSKRKRGEPLGALAGLPIAVKDVLCVAGQRTTCGSRILAHFVPPYDAHVVARLKHADAVLLGKTNLDEFAMGSSTENSSFQITRNPWDRERIPGGSSGGSAAAVAAGMTPLALGTDTGGSVRQPAALCGVVGLKPSYGRVSRYGLIAYGSSLDQVGPFARDVYGAALLLETIAGHDPRDSTCVFRTVPPYTQSIEQPIKPLTIGVPTEFFALGLDAEVEQAVRAALKVYQDLGATLTDVSLPHSRFAVAAYYLVATAEASSNLARYDGVHFGHRTAEFDGLIDMVSKTRGEGFGKEVKRRIMLGTYALSSGYIDAYYQKALKVRRLIKNDFDKAFAGCDVIMGPTSPTPAFKIGEKTDDPLAMYLSDIYTISGNLAGLCGISVPCGFTKTGLPMGLQIQAAPFEEEKLLRVARMHEQATNWHRARPN
ncbi:MAG: Asp-tRNA(Asn)/Glu-tRNA(Gln) amidotransferase subunit GatA [Gemmataceae bacterium]|nr:Asp-tRNA(Asn)/Glu-tRNA(Gln) amidotransferase subunit GatA [Gemmataceae bacterium]MCI0742687.1 Asp-tRNA(Asn)/Glu-tRNA(Gln) amidotransferase subunit GatA [Gemmataceae bacterium]